MSNITDIANDNDTPTDNEARKSCRQLAHEHIERALASDEHVFMFDKSAYDEANIIVAADATRVCLSLDEMFAESELVNVMLWPISYWDLDNVDTTHNMMRDFVNVATEEDYPTTIYLLFGREGQRGEILDEEPDKRKVWNVSHLGKSERDDHLLGKAIPEAMAFLRDAASRNGCRLEIVFDGSLQMADEALFTAAEFKPVKNWLSMTMPRLERGMTSWNGASKTGEIPRNHEVTYEYRGDPAKLSDAAVDAAEKVLLASLLSLPERVFYDGYAREMIRMSALPFKHMELSCQGQPEPVAYRYVPGLIEAMSERFLAMPASYVELGDDDLGGGKVDAETGRMTAHDSAYIQSILPDSTAQRLTRENKSLKRFAMFLPHDERMLAVAEECKTFLREAGDIIDIWCTFLEDVQGQPEDDPSAIEPIVPYYQDLLVMEEAEEEEIDFSLYEKVSYELGIDKAIRAYFDGVPIGDVTA